MAGWKKISIIFFLFAFNGLFLEPVESYSAPFVGADAAVMIEGATGEILYAKNPNKLRPPASTTKIMTAGLVLSTERLKGLVKVSQKAGSVGESSMYLEAGQVLSVEDLIYGALLPSGNDACVALAEALSGDEKSFAQRMTLQAHLLGAFNTNFCNSNGLPDQAHLTTALDLALITRWALTNRNFAKIVSTKEKVIPFPDRGWNRYLKNTNKLLWEYPWADGVKTGTTNAAGCCLVASATKEGRQLIVVLLNSPSRFQEAKELLEFGFSKFELVSLFKQGEQFIQLPVEKGQSDLVPVIIKEDMITVMPQGGRKKLEKILKLNYFPALPLEKGRVLGSLTLLYEGKPIKTTDLLAGATVLPANWHTRLNRKLEGWK